jgi:DNA-binding GntR family transcriptional regulator
MVTRMIDYGAGEPPYRQVAGILRARIASGELHGRVPSERALAQEYGVALNTVRKAVAVLKDEGLIYTIKGWGTFTTGSGEQP